MWQEFKKFAFQGNVFDLAVAVVIGTAFNAIVTSFVDHILTPIIGALAGGVDFTGLVLTIGAAEIAYGNFIQSFADFLIIAFSIFMAIRLLTRLKLKKTEEKEETPSKEEELLTEIRDLLKEQNSRN